MRVPSGHNKIGVKVGRGRLALLLAGLVFSGVTILSACSAGTPAATPATSTPAAGAQPTPTRAATSTANTALGQADPTATVATATPQPTATPRAASAIEPTALTTSAVMATVQPSATAVEATVTDVPTPVTVQPTTTPPPTATAIPAQPTPAPLQKLPEPTERVQRNEGGGVTIQVTWEAGPTSDGSLRFVVAMDTHSVNLDKFDLTKLATLRDDQGLEVAPQAWEGPPGGGHHRSGKLVFPGMVGGDLLVDASTKYLELTIRDVAGVKERVLRWDLESNT